MLPSLEDKVCSFPDPTNSHFQNVQLSGVTCCSANASRDLSVRPVSSPGVTPAQGGQPPHSTCTALVRPLPCPAVGQGPCWLHSPPPPKAAKTEGASLTWQGEAGRGSSGAHKALAATSPAAAEALHSANEKPRHVGLSVSSNELLV